MAAPSPPPSTRPPLPPARSSSASSSSSNPNPNNPNQPSAGSPSGTYFENIDVKGKAITVTSSDGAAKTIIDGGGTAPVVTFQSQEARASVISNFTLRNGKWGVLVSAGSNPPILNNSILNNACNGY